jgi:hypothetical protein
LRRLSPPPCRLDVALMAHSGPPSRCETWGCRVDRRNFLKTSGAVLSLPLLNGCVPRALIAASEPVVESVVKTCAGTWRGLPLGWARFTDFFNGSPPLNQDGSTQEDLLLGSLYEHPREWLAARGLTEDQVAHALGECDCAAGTDITLQNDVWWGLADRDMTIEMNGKLHGWSMPDELHGDDCSCNEYDDFECALGTFFPPGERPDTHDLLNGYGIEQRRKETLARMERRKALAKEFGGRSRRRASR